jgi:2-polyprenyl-3-methyl-5-hydroxy-6-metoxy-1,4-benzoquinol methylase
VTLEPIDFYTETTWSAAVDRELEPREPVALDLLRGVTGAGGGALLDVGCGPGVFMAAADRALGLTSRGWELHGVDYSEYVLERARQLPYAFRWCNLEEGIPYDDETFDVAYAGEVLEHVYDPDLLIRETRRVLKPGGHLIATTPNLQAWYNRALFLVGIMPLFYETSTKSTAIGAGPIARIKRRTTPVGHLRVFNRRALLDLLRSEQLEPVELRAAAFHALPVVVQSVDRLIGRLPSLGSVFVVLARRPD